MDLFTVGKLIEKSTMKKETKKEQFQGGYAMPPPPHTVTMTATAHSATVATAATKQMTAFRIIYSIISFAVSVYAVYLSWSCNSAANVNVLLKVIYAFFAFIFGFLYLIFYFIFRAGTCTTLKGAAAASNVVVGGRRRFYRR
jgi:hypothetical protein